MTQVEEPGVYDLPASTYHSDPVPGGSLSSTGARKLLPPSCPALFRHWNTHGEDYNPTYELGHAVHAEVLGVGAPIVPIDAEDWRTKAAQAQRDEAREAGSTPLLRAEYERVQDMTAALRVHPLANVLLRPDAGKAEQSLFWVDEVFGVWRRAMLDYRPIEPIGDQLIIVDYKTVDCGAPGAVSKAVANYGYAQQAAWYLDGFAALRLDENYPAAYLLVLQEKIRPYLVTVAQPDPEALMWGQRLNRKAMSIFQECRDADHWPGYSDDVISVGLPSWATYQYQAAWELGELGVAPTGDLA